MNQIFYFFKVIFIKKCLKLFILLNISLFFLFNCSDNNLSSSEKKGNTEKTGNLTHSKDFKNSTSLAELEEIFRVAVSPDNKNVYVTGNKNHSLVVFNRNTSDGSLTYSKNFKDGEGGVDGLLKANWVTVSPDNKNVYVTGNTKKSLVVFNRNTTDGSLTYSTNFKNGEGGVDGINTPTSLTVSPDNKNVYVTGNIDDSLAVFNRNTTDGSLTYSTNFKDTVDGVVGLDGARSVIVSPDNKNVYLLGAVSKSLVVFNRNTTDGSLTYSKSFTNGEGGVIVGLDRAQQAVISLDNKSIYVVSIKDNSLVVFNRNTTDGSLTYSTNFKHTQVDALEGATTVAVSPDGKNVYVSSYNNPVIEIFNRNASTGSLTHFKSIDRNNKGALEVRYLTISPDNNNLYITGYYTDSLSVFNRN